MGCANSGPGRLRLPEMMWMDRPGFSLCATPLESLGPGFSRYTAEDRGMSRRTAERWRRLRESERGQDLVSNLVDIRSGSTVHWRLTFITTGDYAGSQAQQGDE